MRIACPSCNATYEVPDAVVAARRTLRCSRCNTDFMARPADDPPAPAPTPEPEPPVGEPKVSEVERPTGLPAAAPAIRPARLVLAAWALSFLVIAAAAWAAVAWRAPIMRAWPPSTRLYVALGYSR